MPFKLKSFDLFIGIIIVELLQLSGPRAGGSVCPRGSGALCWSRVHFTLLGPPLPLSFHLGSVASLLLLYRLLFDQQPWFLLSPTSWCTPDFQPKPVLTLKIHLLTAAGHLHRECAPRVPFSWIWYDWGPLERIFFTCLPCRHFKFTKAKMNLVL